MKANFEIRPEMPANESRFKNSFFDRFELRHAPQPLRLNDQVSKNYLFPTFYTDVTCAIGIFHCDYEKARAIMPDSRIKPVRMLKGRSLVIFSCYEYKNVMNVAPYNEIAMTIPVLAGEGLDLPVLPMLLSGMFSNFGYYVFSMPVTSKENQIRGRSLWGLPKDTQDIEIAERDGYAVTVARDEQGQPYFELSVPTGGKPTTFDVRGKLYSKLDNRIVRAETCFNGDFNVTKQMRALFKKGATPDRAYLKIHDRPAAKVLKSLDIEEQPFQFRYTRGMNAAFDLPEQGYSIEGRS